MYKHFSQRKKPVSGVLESNIKDVGTRKEKDAQCTEKNVRRQ